MARVRTHSGEVLKKELLMPLGLSAQETARAIGIPANRLTKIAHDLSKAEQAHSYKTIKRRSAA